MPCTQRPPVTEPHAVRHDELEALADHHLQNGRQRILGQRQQARDRLAMAVERAHQHGRGGIPIGEVGGPPARPASLPACDPIFGEARGLIWSWSGFGEAGLQIVSGLLDQRKHPRRQANALPGLKDVFDILTELAYSLEQIDAGRQEVVCHRVDPAK